MAGQPTDPPSDHERRVAEEEQERSGEASPTAETQRPSYDKEVEAEQEGRRADEQQADADEGDSPLDAGYQPRSG